MAVVCECARVADDHIFELGGTWPEATLDHTVQAYRDLHKAIKSEAEALRDQVQVLVMKVVSAKSISEIIRKHDRRSYVAADHMA